MTYPKRKRPEPVHPIPRMCRWFGHQWHNDHNPYMVVVPDYCLRDGCPGDDHLWVHDYVDENDVAHEHCRYEGCDATSEWKVPNMSLDAPAGGERA